MPVEIRELQINAVVQDAPVQNQSPAANVVSTNDTEEIVALCVEQVLEILKQRNER